MIRTRSWLATPGGLTTGWPYPAWRGDLRPLGSGRIPPAVGTLLTVSWRAATCWPSCLRPLISCLTVRTLLTDRLILRFGYAIGTLLVALPCWIRGHVVVHRTCCKDILGSRSSITQ